LEKFDIPFDGKTQKTVMKTARCGVSGGFDMKAQIKPDYRLA
jgi:hypothetical protein